jgi:hypothetical protein
MTLKEKFENIEFAFPANESVKIADDYAIEFAKWILQNEDKFITVEEAIEGLLKIFKEEKEL